MTIPEIIEALTPYTGRFPKQAMKEAIAQQQSITPHLLNILEEVANAPGKFAGRTDYMLHVFAVYLLAQFREKRAYLILCKLLAVSGELASDLFGDTITERLKNILATLYDGNAEPIKRLIEDDAVYGYVRGSALETFLVLVYNGQMPRQEVVEYFRGLFRGKLIREHSQVWNELACAVADLPAPELLEELREAYKDGLVDPGYADLPELEHDAQIPQERKRHGFQEKFSLINDAISEMEWWASFHRHEHRPRRSKPAPSAGSAPKAQPLAHSGAATKAEAKIGRNEPCPCGSGKKYKRCCLGKSAAQ